MTKHEKLKWTSANKVYTCIEKIGIGGNGRVYRVITHDGKSFALKVLSHANDKKAYNRFKDEISVLYQLKDLETVIPMVDSHLPDTPNKTSVPFYVMPLGLPLVEYLKDKEPKHYFEVFLILAESLKQLHDRDITHRDIKPANILVVNEVPVFSDFGLANFPKKNRVSSPNESIGAKWTIAPEMQRIANKAEYKKADIYSLAKTLWILITGQQTAFEGQYVPESPISIKRFIDLQINMPIEMGEWNYHSVVLLEKLLILATSNDPDERPDAGEFVRQLSYWFNSNDDYHERNPYEWQNALNRIFPIVVPARCEWIGAANIVLVLNILMEYDSLAYIFLPEHGGDHLRSIKIGPEKNTILVNDDIVIIPARLLFESIKNDTLWSYFRLESETLSPISDTTEKMEYLFYGPHGFTSEWHSDCFERHRVLSGCIIFIHNTGWINRAGGHLYGHSGYHSSVDAGTYKAELTSYLERASALNALADSEQASN